MHRRFVLVLALLLTAGAAGSMAQTAEQTGEQAGPQTDAAAALADDLRLSDARAAMLEGDYAAGLPVVTELAAAGHPRAQNILGWAYQYGNGVAQDATEAQRWFRAAGAQSYPPGLHNLGVLSDFGMPGLGADPVAACDWYRRAAALDYGPAQGPWGACLYQGTAGPLDRTEAMRVFRRGAELGGIAALNWLGMLYRHGADDLPADPEAALRHYSAAGWLGNAEAQNAAGEMLEHGEAGPPDPYGALNWYRRAVAGGDAYGGINAAWLIFENPAEFADQVQGLAYCDWAVAHATPDAAEEYRSACDDMALSFSAEDRARAAKIALAM